MSEMLNGNDSRGNQSIPEPSQLQTPAPLEDHSSGQPVYSNSPYTPPFGAGPVPNAPPQPPYMPYAAQGVGYAYYQSPAGQYPPAAYAPYPQPKKRGGCLRAFGVCLGTLCAIAILTIAIGFTVGVLQKGSPTAPSTSSGDWEGGGDSSPDKEQPSVSNGNSAVSFDPSKYADPNGPSLNIMPPPANLEDSLTPKEIAAKFKASVVSISLYTDPNTQTPDTLYGEGTGIVMTSDGYILTNSHVVGDSLSRSFTIIITTSTQQEYKSIVVGFDSRTDLAVLKIDATNLSPAEFGDSTKLEIGDPLVAIGNGGGIKFAGSVTAGIVSAVDRSIDSDIAGAVKYIQTDAAINPGNSGGPLINQYGQVIGVNTAKFWGDGYEGMGFAIPSMTVRPIVDDLIHTGYVTGRSRLGITCEPVYSYDGYSVVIRNFSDDSDFHNTEARVGDIIVEMDGHEIFTVNDVYAVIGNHRPGDVIEVKLIRPSVLGGGSFTTDGIPGKTYTVSVKLLADLGDTQQVETEMGDEPVVP